MAFPTVEGFSTIAVDTTSPTSVSPANPAHQTGDILFAQAHLRGDSAISTVTAGWAKIVEIDSGITARSAYFWKRAEDASEPDIVITSSTEDLYAVTYVIRGCITDATPYEDVTTRFADSTSVLSSEIDTTAADRLAIAMAAIGIDDPVSSIPPANWTLEANQASGTGEESRMIMISKEEAVSATVSSVQICSNGIGDEKWMSMTLAFIPAGEVSGTNAQINIGDDWKEIAAAQINIGDTWKAVAGMQVNIGDTWKTIF